MANFLIDKEKIQGNTAVLDGEILKHIKTVLRMKAGDGLTLCDGEGMFYDAVIRSLGESAEADITSAYPAPTEPKLKITLFQAVPKNPKLEFIVQKATEIGVVEIIPVNTARIVAKLEKDSKLERLRKIAREAAAQSKRGVVPRVGECVSFAEAVRMAKEMDLAVIPYEDEHTTSIKECLRGRTAKTLALFIGPEGGFDEAEVALARENGLLAATLGPRILRTETAGLVAASICLYELGEME
ncbi:MAG: 16S rRNA (uracil(1498)-N(3))-methyltransferase [Oscillospiraceae bacterium]|nr:16S rRNA (uracil(1498)-N(3))-methyltransferase [Oscillospiraceae bacterium]